MSAHTWTMPWPFIGVNNFEMGWRIGNILLDSSEKIGLAVVYSDKAPGIHAERELVEMGISVSLGERLSGPMDTTAAAQTLVDLNLVGQIQIIGFGADPGVVENIRKGIISASVAINSERIGYEAVHSLASLRSTGYTSASIDIGIDIITNSP